MKKIIFLVPVFIGAIALTAFISSCGNPGEKAVTNTADSTTVDSSAITTPDEPQEYISIPSPDEMFSFIKSLGGEGKSITYLNNPDNYKNYVDTKSKSLNFGIYATDFLYCSTFDYGAEALRYFVNVKKLGDDLGISNVISESTANRIKNNIGKNDSLTDISNTIYFSSVSEFEKNNKGNVLSLVIVGGWIESMHLVTNMVKKYKADNPAIDRIAEQKYTLENILGYLDKYKSDASVEAVAGQLKELSQIYSSLKEETVSGTVSKKGKNKILGGGTKISITESQYKEISEKIKSIRGSFVSGK